MLGVACFAAPSCHRASSDVPNARMSASDASSTRAARAYRPVLDAARSRIAARLASAQSDAATDAGAVIRDLRHIDVPGTPTDLDTWAFRDGTGAWHTAVVSERDVAFGLEAAERILALRTARNEMPSAVDLTRIVGTLHYYPWRIYDGHDWIGAAGDTPAVPGATPSMFTRPNIAGRVLMFSYAVPDGTPGAGIHVANIRITDSGYLIDAAPRR
jgi:hypothetical protein